MKYLGPISDPKDMVNKEYVDNNASGHEELTQLEYDALSQAEKENGTVYFITDGEPDYTIINDSVPIGAVQAYAGASIPYGWLFCDGTAVSRTTYSDLFAAIGTTYGSGNGSTTFNLPDLRGRTLVGVGNSGATGSTNHTLGQKAGEEKHTLTVDEMPSHNHRIREEYGAITASSCPPNATYSQIAGNSAGTKSWQGDPIENTGNGLAHNNMQPYAVANYIIKALNTVSSSALEELDPQSIIFDLFYPIGSYYETSDSTFNPNVQWRGTWIQDSKGRVLVAQDPDQTEFDTVGEMGGEKTHTLVENELPNIKGSFSMHGQESGTAIYHVYDHMTGTVYSSGFKYEGEKYTGATSMQNVGFEFGGNKAHNNLQPYTVAYRWHRIA